MKPVSLATLDNVSQTTPGVEEGHLGSKPVSDLTMHLKGGDDLETKEILMLMGFVIPTILLFGGFVTILALGGKALVDPTFASDLGLSTAGAWALTGVGGGLILLTIVIRSLALHQERKEEEDCAMMGLCTLMGCGVLSLIPD